MKSRSTRSVATLAACMALLAFATSAAATDKLYKWKDANGVTHYGDAPPAQGDYEDRQIPVQAGAPADGADVGEGVDAGSPMAGAEDPQCGDVRENLALLRSDRQLQEDADGDGKPDRILSQAERSTQIKLAEDMLKTNCGAPAA